MPNTCCTFVIWFQIITRTDVRADITKAVKEAFDANGVTIPFQHVVYVPYKAPADANQSAAAAPPPMAPSEDD